MKLFSMLFSCTQTKAQAQKTGASEAYLRRIATLPSPEALKEVAADRFGLTTEEAEERLDEFGPNVIRTGKTHGPLYRFMGSLINPFNIVLFLVAAITFVTDVVLSRRPDYLTAGVILALILLSSLISFIQGEKSHSAAQELSSLISNKTSILRDGAFCEIDVREVVRGDIVRLSAGDMLPGDILFLTAKDAFVAQAALTGESAPVEKFATAPKGTGKLSLTDFSNLGFMGSDMVSGSAIGLVVATGNETYFGSMAKSLSNKRAKNSFEKGVESVSRLLLGFTLVMVPIIFLINGFVKGDWGNSFLFAVTMAVGLTPEMLPVIMTSTLARGALTMSRHDVIVKSLPSIQSFGEMDILCTDKTGTLTEDKIVLEKYMNMHGQEDLRILRHAFLNSYFQTGLKNLIDLAILQRAQTEELFSVKEKYQHVDEIPFDFSRRRMSVVLKDTEGKRQLITKGAVEEVLSICSFAELDGQVVPLDDDFRAQAIALYEAHNFDGLRMLAVAQKNDLRTDGSFGVEDERDMVLMGFIGFLDPPKQSAAEAISALKEYGVDVVVLTGDSEGVAVKVCEKVGIPTAHRLTGADIARMDDEALSRAIQDCRLFSKLAPDQKERVVRAYRTAGHTVGYMGDGINDTLAMRAADIGISVDSAVDIAKETADIILMKKDLMVLEQGVLEGRKTFGNIVKYIKMAASGNFGNMISVIFASLFLPFLPLLPVQILAQNLICDFAQMGLPFDRVDAAYIRRPHRWDTGDIRRFMLAMGPVSSLFDILCYLVLWHFFGADDLAASALFQCGVFAYGTISQLVTVHILRTAGRPFLDSRPAPMLLASTIGFSAFTLLFCLSGMARALDMATLPLPFLPWLLGILAAYCLGLQGVKRLYTKKTGVWL